MRMSCMLVVIAAACLGLGAPAGRASPALPAWPSTGLVTSAASAQMPAPSVGMNLPTAPPPDAASGATLPAADRVLCGMATSDAERETGVPNELLMAISRVETGRRSPNTGAVRAWPWTIDVEGRGHFYASERDAEAAVRAFEAAGARSIDVGCMQVNLLQHPDAFATLSEAFDPRANALWAARFLVGLFRQTGSWPHAAAAYHSQTPSLGAAYEDAVLRMWADGDEGSSQDGSAPSSTTGRPDARTTHASDPDGAGGGDGGGGSPFGAEREPVIASRYVPPAPAPSGASSGAPGAMARGGPPGAAGAGGVGKGLSAYRAMPVAMARIAPFSSRF